MSRWSSAQKVNLTFAGTSKEITLHVDGYLGNFGCRLAQSLCREIGRGDAVNIGITKEGIKQVWWVPLLRSMSDEASSYASTLIAFMDKLADAGVPETGPFKFLVRGARGEIFTLKSVEFPDEDTHTTALVETSDDQDNSENTVGVDPVTGLRLSF